MSSFRVFVPLFIAAAILLAGNGVQGTAIAIRGAEEGFSTSLIGLIGTAYFAGFLLGCLYITRMLNAVGHIRTFAALAALTAVGTTLLVIVVDPWAWLVLRFVVGFCFSGLFTTIESWINSGVRNETRGRVLAVYRIIDIFAVTSAQFMLPLFGTGGFTLFALMGIMITLSLVPVSLADRSNPTPPSDVRFDLKGIWRLSPLACIGCVTIGATNAAFRLIGPLYAEEIGLSINDVAIFMSLGIVGGAVLQYPLGALSDRYDRRTVLMGTTFGAVFSGLFLAYAAGDSIALNYLGIFMFGAFALPLYSLSAAHANDHAGPGDYVMVAAGLMFFFSLGATVGPYASSAFVEAFGPSALFAYTTTVHCLLILATIWRMRARGPVPDEARGHAAWMLRTSPVFGRMARGAPEGENGSTSADPSANERADDQSDHRSSRSDHDK